MSAVSGCHGPLVTDSSHDPSLGRQRAGDPRNGPRRCREREPEGDAGCHGRPTV